MTTLLDIILFIFKMLLKQLVLVSSIENYLDLKRGNFMKILITGITGRIGSNVAKYFINLGHEVTGFSWMVYFRSADRTCGFGGKI